MEATLPRGLIVDGRPHRAVTMRPLAGRDEEFLLEHGGELLPTERDTALIARCTERIGSFDDVTEDLVRSLCLGDRQALLLALCTTTAGGVLESTVTCSEEACGERLELAVDVAALLDQPHPEPAELYECALGEGPGAVRVRFRLPDGALQQRASRLPSEEAERLVVDDCVTEVLGAGESSTRLPDELIGPFARVVERLDPLAETRLEVTCPSCGTASAALLDAGEYLAEQATSERAAFYAEVHLLASRYHWSEAEILSLPVSKRRLYVGLVDSADTEVWP